jgi:hypothetical protein
VTEVLAIEDDPGEKGITGDLLGDLGGHGPDASLTSGASPRACPVSTVALALPMETPDARATSAASSILRASAVCP